MKGHSQKKVPDRVLKGMILKTIFESEVLLTSQEIHDYVSSNTFHFESPELNKFGKPLFSGHYLYNNLDSIRKELTYCRRAGYVKKVGEKRPFHFSLTDEGKLHAVDPFIKYRIKQERMIEQSFKYAERILKNDEKVAELAEKKRIEKCKSCRDAKPKTSKSKASTPPSKMTKKLMNARKKSIKVPDADGNINEISVNKNLDDNFIKTLQEMIDFEGKIDAQASTVLCLQNENAELRKLVGKAGVELFKANNKIENNARKSKKTMQRQYSREEIAEAYWADENGNAYPLSQEFFDLWGGDYLVVVLEKILELGQIFEAGKVDVLSKGSEMYQRRKRYIQRELVGDEIYQQALYIQEIKSSGIVIDSENMIAPKLLKW